MKRLSPEEIQKLDIENSTKAFITDQQNAIHLLKRDLEAAQKACAEMRGIIMQFSPANERWQNMVNHALSSECGRGFFPTSELDETVAVLKAAIVWARQTQSFACEAIIRDRLEPEVWRLLALKEKK